MPDPEEYESSAKELSPRESLWTINRDIYYYGAVSKLTTGWLAWQENRDKGAGKSILKASGDVARLLADYKGTVYVSERENVESFSSAREGILVGLMVAERKHGSKLVLKDVLSDLTRTMADYMEEFTSGGEKASILKHLHEISEHGLKDMTATELNYLFRWQNDPNEPMDSLFLTGFGISMTETQEIIAHESYFRGLHGLVD